jgi:hypothetical protein
LLVVKILEQAYTVPQVTSYIARVSLFYGLWGGEYTGIIVNLHCLTRSAQRFIWTAQLQSLRQHNPSRGGGVRQTSQAHHLGQALGK